MRLPPPKLPPTTTRTEYFALSGGLDQVTPPLEMPSGRCLDALNYECNILGGYSRIGGYERYDGHTSPSSATYSILPATITGAYGTGVTLTGGTSAATALIADTDSTGFVITNITGSFQAGEALKVSGVTIATSTSVPTPSGASTLALDAQYLNAAADVYRNSIAAVPGTGSILGLVWFNNKLYAFRNNVLGTAADMYVSSASGWTQVALGSEISFTVGSGTIAVGNTLTQGGVTATINKVIITSGSLGAGTAAGRLILGTVSGGSYAAGAATTAAGTLTLSGVQTAITLAPSGRYEFDIYNFGGSSGTSAVYGASGVHRAFEYDGTAFSPITTGMTTDTPTHIKCHKKHLFLSFGASVQHSGIGTPFIWTPLLGATELAVGDTVTGFIVQRGTTTDAALSIFARNSTSTLYGTSALDWNLVTTSSDTGARAYSMQTVAMTYVLDDRGVQQMAAVQEFGNFNMASVSALVRDYVDARRGMVADSSVSRGRDQYRLHFTDGSSLYMTVNGQKIVGCMPVQFPNAVTVTASGEASDGTEQIFFGSTNGMVYQLDVGTSFDGAAIPASLTLAFNHSRSPRILKRYRKAIVEVKGEAYVSFRMRSNLGYGDPEIPATDDVSVTSVELAGSRWDSVTWDQFVWSSRSIEPLEAELLGTAENIAMLIETNSDLLAPFTIASMILHYTVRRQLR